MVVYRLNIASKCKIRSACRVSFRWNSSESKLSSNLETKPRDPFVWNLCNIQMIPDDLRRQIFIDSNRQISYTDETIKKCRQHLEDHSLWNQRVKPVDPVNLLVPKLEGMNIDDHFKNIAIQQTHEYKRLLDYIAQSQVPPQPTEWSFKKGWTKYLQNGTAVSVPYPEEDVMVFDVEVCVPLGNAPTLACAVTPTVWYSWCSDALIEDKAEFQRMEKETRLNLDDLIPLETLSESFVSPDKVKKKIVIGHNVSYDRARIKEQYFLKETKTRFIDTMSLHIAVSGITSFQRALKLAAKSGDKSAPQSSQRYNIYSSFLEWSDQSSLNNLADVYKLYCNQELSKTSRDIFLKGNIQEIRSQFQSLVTYCASDVTATKNVFSKLLPLYYERFPHPVTLAGMFEMGVTYLPINQTWRNYIDKSEMTFNNSEMEVKTILMQKADEALQLLDGERYKNDPWLWDLDWKVPKKRKSKKDPTDDTQSYPAWYRKLLYKKTDADYMPGPAKISTSMRVVPKLLKLTWYGFPLYHSKKGGWGFLIENVNIDDSKLDNEILDTDNELNVQDEADSASFPYEHWLKIWDNVKASLLSKCKTKPNGNETVVDVASTELRKKSEHYAESITDFVKGLNALSATGRWSSKDKTKTKVDLSNCSPHPNCKFIPLPHKDGPSNRVGNPLAKDFLSKIEEGVLTCADDNNIADQVVRLSKMTSYWRNNRDRILGQMTVWLKPSEVQQEFSNISDGFEFGSILPQVAVSGTLTRRAVEPTWMTASNAYEDRIGSELKGMVQSPPGYHFVGADVDSQELWIASVIGDASFTGIHGSTALGWMTLQGNKNAGTDMHSKTASLIGIGRDQAKILNYGRIYGAGVNFAERLLLQFNRQLSAVEARNKAKTMYKLTKGERKYLLNAEGRRLCESFEDLKDRQYEAFTKKEIFTLMNYHQIPSTFLMELVDKLVWNGGTESHMFNRLEEIAQGELPRTPVLGCCISRSLIPSAVQNDFMTSRVNWVVQSSAVDYLHIMLTCMRWLIEKYEIQARFSISVHDEVRYLVKSEDRYRAALALQITNLLTRSFCVYRLGLTDLPMSVAFFSCVDIDKVLRKEVTQDCSTPSNPLGLSGGYEIPLGQGLNINEILKETNGSLEKQNQPASLTCTYAQFIWHDVYN